MLAGHNCYLELFEYKSPKQTAEPPGAFLAHEPGIRHIAFYVDDVRKEFERFLSVGGQALGELVERELQLLEDLRNNLHGQTDADLLLTNVPNVVVDHDGQRLVFSAAGLLPEAELGDPDCAQPRVRLGAERGGVTGEVGGGAAETGTFRKEIPEDLAEGEDVGFHIFTFIKITSASLRLCARLQLLCGFLRAQFLVFLQSDKCCLFSTSHDLVFQLKDLLELNLELLCLLMV